MGMAVDIYGSLVQSGDMPLETLIEGYGLPKEQQIWQRKELPSFFDKVEIDKDGNVFLTSQQEAYARREIERCKHGFWLYINGVPTYITGKHYFYLQWWKLEDDIYADYRDTDRRYFLFLNHWEHVLWCLGVIRGKKRREGASSQACSNLVYEAIFFKNSNCGLISKTRDDSRDTFTDMVTFGYRQLPVFMKPKQMNKEDSVTELVFAHKSMGAKEGKISTISEDRGHRSKINFRAPVLNAYDRGRMSRVLCDEFGKLDETPASQLFAILRKTLVKGVKRVGFIEMPSTVNRLTKGGAEFRVLWDNAELGADKYKPTTNRLVRYFTPAYDGLEGFIGQFGESIISEPTYEQYQYLVDKWVKKDEQGNTVSEISEDDIKMGAYKYLLSLREGLTGDSLEEEIRQNPFDEIEMFMASNTDCIFNKINIERQKKYLKENPAKFRNVLFNRDERTQVVHFRDINKADGDFYWQILAFPAAKDFNKIVVEDGIKKPGRTDDGCIGVDGYSNSQGGKKYGSKGSGWIFKKYDINDPENSGLFIGHLFGRPNEKNTFHEQVLLAAEFFGYEVSYEFTADDYYTYFKDRGKLGYLSKFPLNTIDPEKRKDGKKVDRFYGFPTTEFALTKQNDSMRSYVEHHCHLIYWMELLDDLLIFEPLKRTPFDRTVSAMIALVKSLDVNPKPPPRKSPLAKIYENPNYGPTAN
jgi:hypothetical protein